nr:MAG TPA_asm: hypothetical protein [Caudoviricetes sp.]
MRAVTSLDGRTDNADKARHGCGIGRIRPGCESRYRADDIRGAVRN